MSRHGPRRDPVKERFWREALRRQAASGLKIREFCAREKVAEAAFYAWRQELRRRDRQAGQSSALMAADHARKSRSRAPKSAVRFLPVSVANVASAVLEVALPSGVVLRVGPDCQRETLRTVLSVLEERRC